MNFLCIKRSDYSPSYFREDDLISLHYGNTLSLSSLLNPLERERKEEKQRKGTLRRDREGKEEPSVLAPLTFGIINYPHYGDYRSKVLLQLAERARGWGRVEGERRNNETK